MKLRKMLIVLLCSVGLFSVSINARAAILADVAFVIDQSGSMGGEFTWLGNAINGIDSALTAGGVTSRYAVAGYERLAGNEPSNGGYVASPYTIFDDFTSNVADITSSVNSAQLYGGLERGYHAADWARTGFSWGADAAKVIILITDEAADQRSGITEAQLGFNMTSGGYLLNVITFSNLFSQWNDAVYTKEAYQGLFDLNTLRTDPNGFTQQFTAAKLQEIKDDQNGQVPEPGVLALMGIGLLGLVGFRRRV